MWQLGSSSSIWDLSLELLSRRAWCWQNWSAAESQGSAGVLSSSQKKHNVFIYCRASPSAFSCTCLWLKRRLGVDFFIRPGFISRGGYSKQLYQERVPQGPSGSDGNVLLSGLGRKRKYAGACVNVKKKSPFLCFTLSVLTVSHFKQGTVKLTDRGHCSCKGRDFVYCSIKSYTALKLNIKSCHKLTFIALC